MVILGLDPGSVCTGYGLIDAGPEELRWCAGGVLRPARGRSLPERLLALHTGLREILQERRPAAVALEESFVGQHARSALILGQARGALTVAILAEGVPLFEYAPRLVKLAVTGTGGASKEQVHAMIQRLIAGVPQGLSFDVTDALALAVCHANRQAAPLCLAGAGGPRPGRGVPRREA